MSVTIVVLRSDLQYLVDIAAAAEAIFEGDERGCVPFIEPIRQARDHDAHCVECGCPLRDNFTGTIISAVGTPKTEALCNLVLRQPWVGRG